jgi:hypothetical protein
MTTFGYAQPFSFRVETPRAETAPPRSLSIKVTGVRHGVTEIALSDGRVVRATLHVRDVKPNRQKPGSVDITYNVVTEVVNAPDVPIMDVHETLQ